MHICKTYTGLLIKNSHQSNHAFVLWTTRTGNVDFSTTEGCPLGLQCSTILIVQYLPYMLQIQHTSFNHSVSAKYDFQAVLPLMWARVGSLSVVLVYDEFTGSSTTLPNRDNAHKSLPFNNTHLFVLFEFRILYFLCF
jgi:hypothetical protein